MMSGDLEDDPFPYMRYFQSRYDASRALFAANRNKRRSFLRRYLTGFAYGAMLAGVAAGIVLVVKRRYL